MSRCFIYLLVRESETGWHMQCVVVTFRHKRFFNLLKKKQFSFMEGFLKTKKIFSCLITCTVRLIRTHAFILVCFLYMLKSDGILLRLRNSLFYNLKAFNNFSLQNSSLCISLRKFLSKLKKKNVYLLSTVKRLWRVERRKKRWLTVITKSIFFAWAKVFFILILSSKWNVKFMKQIMMKYKKE